MKKALHSNNTYDVYVSDTVMIEDGVVYKSCYAVMNSSTGVVELFTPCLPTAIHSAEQWDQALETEAWNWRKGTVDAGTH